MKRQKTAGAKRRALIVDDQEAYRIFLRDIFERNSYNVLTASGGTQALELAGMNTFDIIVTDMVMPDMEGREFIARLRAGGSKVPIVAITGYLDGHACLEAVDKYQVSGVIYKPFAANEVSAVVEQVMQGAAC